MNNARGFSLIEMTIAAAAVSFFLVLTAFLISHQLEEKMKIETMGIINELRAAILSNLDNIKVWTATKTNDPSFQCLIDQIPCAAAARNFSIIDSSGAIMPLAFSAFGFSCAGAECAARYDLTWEPICNGGGACLPTQIRIRGTLTVLKPDAVPRSINVDSHGFVLVRSAN